MDILYHKGYEGTAELDMSSLTCHGKVLFINDLVTYQADSPRDLEKEFMAAVDDYLETCQELGKEAQKPSKGLFQVRVSPELHRMAILRGMKDGVTLNVVVGRAMDAYLCGGAPVNHNNITVNITSSDSDVKTISSIPSPYQSWEMMRNVKPQNH